MEGRTRQSDFYSTGLYAVCLVLSAATAGFRFYDLLFEHSRQQWLASLALKYGRNTCTTRTNNHASADSCCIMACLAPAASLFPVFDVPVAAATATAAAAAAASGTVVSNHPHFFFTLGRTNHCHHPLPPSFRSLYMLSKLQQCADQAKQGPAGSATGAGNNLPPADDEGCRLAGSLEV